MHHRAYEVGTYDDVVDIYITTAALSLVGSALLFVVCMRDPSLRAHPRFVAPLDTAALAWRRCC
jgi:hypothetical protein